jgi:NADPH2:quinone reductase
LASYARNAAELNETSEDLFNAIASGAVNISIHQRFKLADARASHEALQARATTGATLLQP